MAARVVLSDAAATELRLLLVDLIALSQRRWSTFAPPEPSPTLDELAARARLVLAAGWLS